MRTILTNVDGFTPVIDDLVDELGITSALVFGRVWRYCQMDFGVCTASQTTIAKDLDLARETVNRCLKQLVQAGYLDETDKPGVTKTYQDTGKAQLIQELRAGTSDRRSQPKSEPVINDHNTCDLKSQPPVINDHTKIDSLRENLREEYIDDPDEKFSRMQHICEMLIGRFMTNGDVPTINKFIQEGVIEEDIRGALAWRIDNGIKPAANIRQLESGVLRTKAARVQSQNAQRPSGSSTKSKETTLDRSLAAARRAMEKALAEEAAQNGK